LTCQGRFFVRRFIANVIDLLTVCITKYAGPRYGLHAVASGCASLSLRSSFALPSTNLSVIQLVEMQALFKRCVGARQPLTIHKMAACLCACLHSSCLSQTSNDAGYIKSTISESGFENDSAVSESAKEKLEFNGIYAITEIDGEHTIWAVT